MTSANTPFLIDTFKIYRTWRTRVAVYATVFILAVSTALILDLRFGVQPSSVLLYMLTLTAVLMIAVPAAVVAVNRFWRPVNVIVDHR